MKSKPISPGTVVEKWELSDEEKDSSESSVQESQPSQPIDVETFVFDPNVVSQIKKERELLQATVQKLNERIGTEVITDDDIGAGPSGSTANRYNHERNRDVNTRYYQLDSTFGKNIYYITDVST